VKVICENSKFEFLIFIHHMVVYQYRNVYVHAHSCAMYIYVIDEENSG
jgi:hypothetical protein